MNKEQIVKQLRDMARHPTVTLPRDCEALKVASDLIEQAQKQEPVAWVYPEGLEALKTGKPWTAYGTRQEPNNTALYLSPQPDIPPYAWVTFTPYGDEDDVWYENPEGQLLEGWTYKPLYDTSPPQRQPLTDEQIFEVHKRVDSMQYLTFARAIEAAHGIKEKNTRQDGNCKHCTDGCPACDARRQPNVLS